MMDIGKIIKKNEKEYNIIRMEINMKDFGKIIKNKKKEYIKLSLWRNEATWKGYLNGNNKYKNANIVSQIKFKSESNINNLLHNKLCFKPSIIVSKLRIRLNFLKLI